MNIYISGLSYGTTDAPRPRDYRDYSIASIALNRPVFQFVAVL